MNSIFNSTKNIISNLPTLSDKSDYELEIRFGYLQKGKFNPDIGKNTFMQIFGLLTNNKKYDVLENAYINDKYYTTGTIRKIKKVDKIMFDTKNYHFYKNDEKIETIYMQKEKLNQITNEYLRISFNKEIKLENIMDNNLRYERMKYRVSIPFEKIFRFDFTIENDNQYSVEIEILLDKVKTNEYQDQINKLNKLLEPIVKVFKKNIFNTLFPPQPHTMNYSDLFIINSNPYAVTDKADGVRAFLKIENNKSILINPKTKQIIGEYGEVNLGNTLIDGEYVNNRFYAFDIMFFDNKDVRHMNLIERLNILIKNIDKIKIHLYLKIKKFYTKNIFEKSKEILDKEYPYNVDGLIYTPIYQCYSDNELPIFKWKKRHTIDVRVSYNKKEDYTYFIYGKRYGKINEWSSQYFERKYIRTSDSRLKKMHRTFHYQEYRDLRKKRIHFGKYKHFNSNTFQDKFLGKSGKPNENSNTGRTLNRNIDVILDKYDIIEYEYRNEDWYPLRKRTFDKDEANAIKTIDSVLKVIEENLTIEKIIEFSKTYKFNGEKVGSMYNIVAQDKAFKRNNWRKFHNYAKRKTIQNASNNCIGKAYLDLACGKGGDLQKYIHLGYKNILAIDSSENELYCKNGYVHRLSGFGFRNKGLYYEKEGIKVTVLCGDVSKNIKSGEFLRNQEDKNKLDDFFSRTDKFDVISIMFAIHYMLDTEDKMESFMDNIDELLKPDGKLIGVYLNINDNENHIFKDHGIPFYKIENKGDKIQIKNSVWGIENTLEEPKINKKTLNGWFDLYSFIEIGHNTFEEFYDVFKMNEGILLTEDEKKLGYMNNYFILVKSPRMIKKSIDISL